MQASGLKKRLQHMYWPPSSVFINNFEQILRIVLKFMVDV